MVEQVQASTPAQAPGSVQAGTQTLQFSRSEVVSILFGLILAMFLASLDQTIVATSLSTMAQDLKGWALMSWVVSAYLVASTVTTPIYGRLSDLYGRRPVLLTSIGLFLAASVLCALSQSMPQLIGARILQGIGGGGLRSVSQAAIADVVPPRERGRYQGYFSSVMAISNLLGPVLGGFFADYLSWHWIFWINLPFGLLAMVLCNRNLKRLGRPRGRAIIDWLGAALIIASTTPLLIGLSRVETAGGWVRGDVLGPLAVGLLLLAALIVWERAAREPMIPLRLFSNSIFTVASVMTIGMSMVMIGLIILVPLDFELAAGLPANQAGLRLIPMTGGTVLGSYIAGQLVSRTGHYRAFPIGGAAVMTLACMGIALFGLGHWLALDIALTIALGLSFGFQLPSVIVPVQNALDLHDTGIGLSCVMFFRLMGGAFGVALLSAVLMSALNAEIAAVPGHAALGPNPGLTLFHLELAGQIDPKLLAALTEAIRTAFTHVFWWAAAISGLTFLFALGFKEIPLRSR
ncbi:MAG: MFS transporter [Alphaproteobacteria bacterium]|nr:MFS transporter [Alphaproteobacteria bacterium]